MQILIKISESFLFMYNNLKKYVWYKLEQWLALRLLSNIISVK